MMRLSRPLALLLSLVACHDRLPAEPAPAPASRVVFVTSGGEVPVSVEVADSPDEHSRGLMFRRELGANDGMLFVFPSETEHSFWMRNTYVPLDMIFVSAELRVVGVIVGAEPLSDASLTVGVPSRYVVEVNAGFATTHGIGAGTAMRLELAR